MSDIDKQREDLTHKTFTMMFQVLLIFAIPVFVGYFVGQWLDTRFEIKPYGTMLVLAVTFISSWAVVIRMYLRVSKKFIELREQEEREDLKNKEKVTE